MAKHVQFRPNALDGGHGITPAYKLACVVSVANAKGRAMRDQHAGSEWGLRPALGSPAETVLININSWLVALPDGKLHKPYSASRAWRTWPSSWGFELAGSPQQAQDGAITQFNRTLAALATLEAV